MNRTQYTVSWRKYAAVSFFALVVWGTHGCAGVLGNLGPKYEPDEVDQLHGKTGAISAKLVRVADTLTEVQNTLQAAADGGGDAVAKVQGTVKDIERCVDDLKKLPADIKDLLTSTQSLLQNAPKRYAGAQALHLPKKMDFLKESIDTLKGMPEQISDIGLAGAELAKCATTLISGGRCDKGALAKAKIEVPPNLRALAQSAGAEVSPGGVGSEATKPARLEGARASVLSCPTVDSVTAKFVEALGLPCITLMANQQLRVDSIVDGGLCSGLGLKTYGTFPFPWVPAETEEAQKCQRTKIEYWAAVQRDAETLSSACSTQGLAQSVRAKVTRIVREECERLSKKFVQLYTTFRAAGGYQGSKWGSSPQEVLATSSSLVRQKDGSLTLTTDLAGYRTVLIYRFFKERLIRVDVSFDRFSDSVRPGPFFHTVEHLLHHRYGDAVIDPRNDEADPQDELDCWGLASLVPPNPETSVALWHDAATIIVLRGGDPVSLVYSSSELMPWASDVEEGIKVGDL